MSGTDGNNESEPKRRLFADVSTVQVVATAAAAVTSMLLSSYIGIAGSVIGVAVASVVSTLAASLYKKFLADSAEKIKELPVVAHPSTALAHVLPGHRDDGTPGEKDGKAAGPSGDSDGEAKAASIGGGEAPTTAFADDAQGAEASQPTEALAAARSAQATEALEAPLGAREATTSEDAADQAGEAAGASTAGSRAAASSAKLDPLAALHRQRRLVRGLIVVCIVSALLAVAASGAVVYFATMGAGLGQKPAPIYLSAPFAPIDDGEDESSGSQAANATSTADNGAASSSSSSSASGGSPSEGGTGEGGSGTGDGDGSGSSGNETDPTNPGGDGGTGNVTPGGPGSETPDPDGQPTG